MQEISVMCVKIGNVLIIGNLEKESLLTYMEKKMNKCTKCHGMIILPDLVYVVESGELCWECWRKL